MRRDPAVRRGVDRAATHRAPASERPAPGAAPVVAFFALACALSWAYWVPLAILASPVERGDGWPTHLPGLLGPMLAAVIVSFATEGRVGVRAWVASMARWPRSVRWRAATLAPLGFLALGIAVAAAVGRAPAAGDFLRYSGTGASLVALAGALIVTGFGEEAGWRGYALPRLQLRHGPMRATLLVTAGWALWHVPLFFVLASYAEFGAFTALGWLIGLTAGSLVLTAVYNGTGGSVLAVALWHALYDAGAATSAGDDILAPVITACVIFWAVSLVQRQRSGLPALGDGSPRRATARA